MSISIQHVFNIGILSAITFPIMYAMHPDPFGISLIDTMLWALLYATILYGIVYFTLHTGFNMNMNQGLITIVFNLISGVLRR